MKILAMDIGAGTEDVLLYDNRKKNIENCVKMVLPSPSQVFAEKVREATRLYKDIFVKGDIIGGGAFAFALRNHVEKGLRAVMTENAAYSVRNDLDEVRRLGIEIITGENEFKDFEGETLSIEEVNLLKLQEFLILFDETLLDVDVVAVAVQDHGVFPKGMSNRRFRIQKMKELLKENPKPEALAFTGDEIPSYFLRMKSAALASKRQLPRAKVLLMDTSPDAILGCLKDPVVEKANTVLAINVGNGHTMAAIISSGNIVGVMEHHTRLLNPQKIERLLISFTNGKLSDKEVFKENGHGLFFLTNPPGFSKIEKVVATGPNRSILAKTNLSVHFATPAGDVMMTGPIGLIEATKRKLKR
ncbi:hypothetical protein E3J49_06680 [Candidatus Bathyarchaeota archaeon]|nr:MAG: hypothetical protein E3J49_06680 [Candidatus Bathyarchaeota archaeon]